MAAELVLTLSSASVSNSGSETVTATATALDDKRNVLAEVPVAITADSNAIVEPSGATTGTDGNVSAVVRIGADRSSRTITVTANSGSLSRTATFSVGVATTTAASDLVLVLSATTVSNSGDEVVTATATALDANRNVMSGIPVVITANSNAFVTPSGTVTGTSGAISGVISIGADTSARSITVTASAGALQRSQTFQVASGSISGQPTLSLSLGSTIVTSSSPATVTATVRDSRGALLSGRVVKFSTVGNLGAFNASSALTDANGRAVVALYPAVGANSGADEVLAEVDLAGATLQATQGFQLSATSVGIGSFASDVPAGSRLSAYGQANLTVALTGTSPGTPVALSVTSTCVTKGKATLVPATTTTTNGTASFTYKDAGCGATDGADALQVAISGGTANASLSLPLQPPTVSSLAFVSATPQQIYLKSAGFDETSQVVFQVRDQSGNPLPNQAVTLSATTRAGGLTLDGVADSDVNPVSKLSDSDGRVTVRINSGTVPTPVRVRASLAVGGATITTVSSNLSVAVGLPSQRNFSLSQGTLNIEGLNIDGIANTYQVIASDRLGNPVPAGTSINFVSEGGQVQAVRQITTGADGLSRTVANFVSASPKPADGRITVLAYALGEESFLDVNGDNVFSANEAFQDLGDVFMSRDFSATYDAINDQFIALGLQGSAACAAVDPAKDPLSLLRVSRSIPSVGSSTCDAGWGRAYVRRAVETVLSSSTARPLWGLSKPGTGTLSNSCAKVSLPRGPRGSDVADYYLFGAGDLYNMPGAGSLSFIVADDNDQRLNPMAAGTVVTVSATTGINVQLLGGSPVANTSEATFAAVGYTFDSVSAGTITVTLRSPSGAGTSFSVNVTTANVGSPCTL
ncbi:Ig-like domain-containing protein [Aquincola sp. J276]|uniref:Ig-like domain-containing protein n=1 Tax=Aquincola sp. J276 TaxID=2898432 RepID=UPI002150DB60|nr:Ig-like domain-containing protein [Aquincola sp. J276]MCR5865609.1 Ig-like domain-containing protein [Aquincola sp. J276]